MLLKIFSNRESNIVEIYCSLYRSGRRLLFQRTVGTDAPA